jgi:hypothetical protein
MRDKMDDVMVDKDLFVTALICCLNSKTMIGMLKDGDEIPQEILDIGESALDAVLNATPAEYREMVVSAIVETNELESILERPEQL